VKVNGNRKKAKLNRNCVTDGHLWIKTNRQNTGTESDIRLLDVAKHII